jgi:hypothetical protein
MELRVTDVALHDVVKQAVIEAIDERREFLRDVIEEEIEEVLLGKLIERNKESDLVPEERIMQTLAAKRAS